MIETQAAFFIVSPSFSPSSDGLLNCGKVVCVEPPLLRRQPIRRA
jgi:hypothetical protein